MPNKQVNLPFYKTKPLPGPVRDFLKRYCPNTDVDSVRLHGWSPAAPLRMSMTIGNDIFLVDPDIYKNPRKEDAKHLFHEFTHKRQWDAGTLTKKGYVRDAIRYRGNHDAIPVEKQAMEYEGLLYDVFKRSPEGRRFGFSNSRGGR